MTVTASHIAGAGPDRAGRGRGCAGRRLSTLELAGDPVAAAHDLIGWTLLVDGVGGPIVETEAYRRTTRHRTPFPGPTARNAVMFGPPGGCTSTCSYGIHWCMNFVCGPEGTGAGVLIRALEPRAGVEPCAPAARPRPADASSPPGPGASARRWRPGRA